MCAYVTLVNTKRKCAKCDISHDLCTDNDKSCNCKGQPATATATAAAATTTAKAAGATADHTHCMLPVGQLKLLLLLLLAEYEIRNPESNPPFVQLNLDSQESRLESEFSSTTNRSLRELLTTKVAAGVASAADESIWDRSNTMHS